MQEDISHTSLQRFREYNNVLPFFLTRKLVPLSEGSEISVQNGLEAYKGRGAGRHFPLIVPTQTTRVSDQCPVVT